MKAAVKKVFEGGDWLTADEIDHRQEGGSQVISNLAGEWKRCGRVFSVTYEGEEYFARYQFDSLYRPLTVIKEVLQAFGQYDDAWSVAAWFYFPNAWITEESVNGPFPVSPKDALGRVDEIINAARQRKGTYVA